MADTIWDLVTNVRKFAELGFAELKSSDYEAGALVKSGFKISHRGIGGIDTSWIATWARTRPVMLPIPGEFPSVPGSETEL